MPKIIGRVVGIAVRTEKDGPMAELQAVDVHRGGGLAGDLPASPDRGVTLLSAAQWKATMDELGAALPWHTRRANLLIDAASLGEWIGRRLRIGSVEIDITQEVAPCGLMDRLQPGLKAALKPDCRGGIGGRILNDGTIRIGDITSVIETAR